MSDQMFEDAQQETISRIQFMKMRSGVPVESVTAVMMPVTSSDTRSVFLIHQAVCSFLSLKNTGLFPNSFNHFIVFLYLLVPRIFKLYVLKYIFFRSELL